MPVGKLDQFVDVLGAHERNVRGQDHDLRTGGLSREPPKTRTKRLIEMARGCLFKQHYPPSVGDCGHLRFRRNHDYPRDLLGRDDAIEYVEEHRACEARPLFRRDSMVQARLCFREGLNGHEYPGLLRISVGRGGHE